MLFYLLRPKNWPWVAPVRDILMLIPLHVLSYQYRFRVAVSQLAYEG